MSSYFITTRINKINEQLLTIAKLQKMGNLLNSEVEQVLSQPQIASNMCQDQNKNKRQESDSDLNSISDIPQNDQTIPHDTAKSLPNNESMRIGRKRKEFIPHKKIIEQLKKEICDERQRNEELQKKNEAMMEEVKRLKEKEEQQAGQLKELLEKYEQQTRLFEKTNNFSSELVKQSDFFKLSRDEMLSQIAKLKKQINDLVLRNNNLNTEQEKWKSKAESEEKKCIKFTDEIKQLKLSLKENTEEKAKLETMVLRLLNLAGAHKKRESEFINICNTHQVVSQQKDSTIVEKEQEICNFRNELDRLTKEYESVKAENEQLRNTLEDKTKKNIYLHNEIEKYKDTMYCDIKVKEKIIFDKSDTINKQKQLLKDSEEMARQAAKEFEHLQDQLQREKETNSYLMAELNSMKNTRISENSQQCENCEVLKDKINSLVEQKQKAVSAAKFAAEKLRLCTQEFRKQIKENII